MRNFLWVSVLGSLLAQAVNAQTFSVVHSFDGRDGSYPYAGLVVKDGLLYGTTDDGGPTGARGTIYSLDGQGNISSVIGLTDSSGISPEGGLTVAKDGALYGSAIYGGLYNFRCRSGCGTLFQINGNQLAVLYTFNIHTGPGPYSLVEGRDGNFYGTTAFGGQNGYGSFFRATPGTWAITTLHSFTSAEAILPYGRLLQAKDGNFYGTAYYGGSFGQGSVFRLSPRGAFTLLHSFQGSDGATPTSGLIQGRDGNFYGTTQTGGPLKLGVVYKMDPPGNITLLHNFDYNDGANPQASLILARDGNFYGTASQGGTFGNGVLFKLSVGGQYTKLYDFTGGADGKIPFSALTQTADGSLYGTANQGGNFDVGTVYKLTF